MNRILKIGMERKYDIQYGYEAGCLGYSLYNQLTAAGVKCVILAPTMMLTQQGVRIKTDARDVHMLAQCLSVVVTMQSISRQRRTIPSRSI